MESTLSEQQTQAFVDRLTESDRRFQLVYPGESGARQPVHTVYGGAHRFRADSAGKLGELAVRALDTYGADPVRFARTLGIAGDGQGQVDERLAGSIHARVREKLQREPVEDFRIDFEDGYGNRSDEEEDAEAVRTAREVLTGLEQGTLPLFSGLRIKPLSGALSRRAIRTLDRFVTTLAQEGGGTIPDHFVITLPKVTRIDEVVALVELLDMLEERHGLPSRSLKLELMIEMPQAILSADGASNLLRLHSAAQGRCVAAHFGTYDYTAACNITAAHQHMMHPACDFAKHMMQVAFAGTGVWLSDGATNVMPVPPHGEPEGQSLSAEQRQENEEAVHRAWQLQATHIRHSLVHGFYQGWDLHPAQLPVRYASVYAFFLEGLEPAAARMRNFVGHAARATLAGEVFDDAATGQGLLNYFLRALGCGAITEDEATRMTGLTLQEIRGRSFQDIVQARRPGG
jgi:citrate lyase beta subunit